MVIIKEMRKVFMTNRNQEEKMINTTNIRNRKEDMVGKDLKNLSQKLRVDDQRDSVSKKVRMFQDLKQEIDSITSIHLRKDRKNQKIFIQVKAKLRTKGLL